MAGMGVTFRKLALKDGEELEGLIRENAESIEPGLGIIDSRLLLGHSMVDLIGLDSRGVLVLIALGFTADEEMLIRTLEAYSWCVEYPETIRRLYPMRRVQTGRPPRVLFIAERLPDAFLRKVKQLVFPEVDCLKFLHLDVNGTPAVYFEAVEQLRPVAAAVGPARTPGHGVDRDEERWPQLLNQLGAFHLPVP